MQASRIITLLLISAFVRSSTNALPVFDSDMIIQEAPAEHSRSSRSVRSTGLQKTGMFNDASPVFHFLNARRAEHARISIVVPEIRKVGDRFMVRFFSDFNA